MMLLQQARCGCYCCCARWRQLAVLIPQRRALHDFVSCVRTQRACGTAGRMTVNNNSSSSGSSSSGSGSSVQGERSRSSSSILPGSRGLHISRDEKGITDGRTDNVSVGRSSSRPRIDNSNSVEMSCRGRQSYIRVLAGWPALPAAEVQHCWSVCGVEALCTLPAARLRPLRNISTSVLAALGCRRSDSSICVRSSSSDTGGSRRSSGGSGSSSSICEDPVSSNERQVCSQRGTRGWCSCSSSSPRLNNGSSSTTGCGSSVTSCKRQPDSSSSGSKGHCGSSTRSFTNESGARVGRGNVKDSKSLRDDRSPERRRDARWGLIYGGRNGRSAASASESNAHMSSSSCCCQPCAVDCRSTRPASSTRQCERSTGSDAFNLRRDPQHSGSSISNSTNSSSSRVNRKGSDTSSSSGSINSSRSIIFNVSRNNMGSSGNVKTSSRGIYNSSITNSGNSIGCGSSVGSSVIGVCSLTGNKASTCSSADLRSSTWRREFSNGRGVPASDSGSSFARSSCGGGFSSCLVSSYSSSSFSSSRGSRTLGDYCSNGRSRNSSKCCCRGLNSSDGAEDPTCATWAHSSSSTSRASGSGSSSSRIDRPAATSVDRSSSSSSNTGASPVQSSPWRGRRQWCSSSGLQTEKNSRTAPCSSSSVSSNSVQQRWFSARAGASRMKWYVVKRYSAEQQRHRLGDSFRFPPATLRRSWAPQLPQPTVDWRYGEPDDTYSWPATTAAGGAAGGGKQQQRQTQQLPAELQHAVEVVGLPMGRTPEYLQERLWRYFNKFGIVERVRVLPHPLDPYQSAGTAYVFFRSRMASLRAVRLPVYLPASLHNRVLQLRHLGTDKTSDFSFYRRMRQAIANTLFIAKQLYNLLEREGPAPLPKALRALFERSYPRLAWRQAGYSIRATCGSWLRFFSREPINEMFFLAPAPQSLPSNGCGSSRASGSSIDADCSSSSRSNSNTSEVNNSDVSSSSRHKTTSGGGRSSSTNPLMSGDETRIPSPSPVSAAPCPPAATSEDASAAGTAAGRGRRQLYGSAAEVEGLVVYPHLLCGEKLQQLLLRAGRVLHQELQQQLSVHWRTDRPALPDWTRQQVEAWQHKPPLPEELQIWSRTKDYYKIHEERFLFKLKLKKERVKAKMELKEQRRRQLLQEQQQHTQLQGGSKRSLAAAPPRS